METPPRHRSVTPFMDNDVLAQGTKLGIIFCYVFVRPSQVLMGRLCRPFNFFYIYDSFPESNPGASSTPFRFAFYGQRCTNSRDKKLSCFLPLSFGEAKC